MGKPEFPRAAPHFGGAGANGNSRASREVPLDRGPRSLRPPAKMSFAGTFAIEEVVSYFETMVEGLKQGVITFRQGPDTLELRPSPQVDMKVKAATKGRKGRLKFEVAWTALERLASRK